MSYSLTLERKDNVLWAAATGTRSLETVLAISSEILAACVEKKVKRVLIDVRGLEGRLAKKDAYDIPDKHFPEIRDRSVITHAAIIDLKEFEDSYVFFENVAVSRGFRLRIFPEPEEAIEWLEK